MKAFPEPWYRQFWPWFLIALPAPVVIASLTMVYVAMQHADQPVKDDYYQEGRAINRRMAEDRVAARLELRADVRLDLETGQLLLKLANAPIPAPEELALAFIHPVAAERDFDLALALAPNGLYIADLPRAPSGHWHLHLSGDVPERWRLRERVNLDLGAQFRLQP